MKIEGHSLEFDMNDKFVKQMFQYEDGIGDDDPILLAAKNEIDKKF